MYRTSHQVNAYLNEAAFKKKKNKIHKRSKVKMFDLFFLFASKNCFSRFVYQTVGRMRRWLDLTCRCLCVELVVEQGEGWMLASTAPPVQGTGAPVPAELRDFPPPPSLSLSFQSARSSLDPLISLSKATSAFSISPLLAALITDGSPGFRFHLDYKLGAAVTSLELPRRHQTCTRV